MKQKIVIIVISIILIITIIYFSYCSILDNSNEKFISTEEDVTNDSYGESTIRELKDYSDNIFIKDLINIDSNSITSDDFIVISKKIRNKHYILSLDGQREVIIREATDDNQILDVKSLFKYINVDGKTVLKAANEKYIIDFNNDTKLVKTIPYYNKQTTNKINIKDDIISNQHGHTLNLIDKKITLLPNSNNSTKWKFRKINVKTLDTSSKIYLGEYYLCHLKNDNKSFSYFSIKDSGRLDIRSVPFDYIINYGKNIKNFKFKIYKSGNSYEISHKKMKEKPKINIFSLFNNDCYLLEFDINEFPLKYYFYYKESSSFINVNTGIINGLYLFKTDGDVFNSFPNYLYIENTDLTKKLMVKEYPKLQLDIKTDYIFYIKIAEDDFYLNHKSNFRKNNNSYMNQEYAFKITKNDDNSYSITNYKNPKKNFHFDIYILDNSNKLKPIVGFVNKRINIEEKGNIMMYTNFNKKFIESSKHVRFNEKNDIFKNMKFQILFDTITKEGMQSTNEKFSQYQNISKISNPCINGYFTDINAPVIINNPYYKREKHATIFPNKCESSIELNNDNRYNLLNENKLKDNFRDSKSVYFNLPKGDGYYNISNSTYYLERMPIIKGVNETRSTIVLMVPLREETRGKGGLDKYDYNNQYVFTKGSKKNTIIVYEKNGIAERKKIKNQYIITPIRNFKSTRYVSHVLNNSKFKHKNNKGKNFYFKIKSEDGKYLDCSDMKQLKLKTNTSSVNDIDYYDEFQIFHIEDGLGFFEHSFRNLGLNKYIKSSSSFNNKENKEEIKNNDDIIFSDSKEFFRIIHELDNYVSIRYYVKDDDNTDYRVFYLTSSRDGTLSLVGTPNSKLYHERSKFNIEVISNQLLYSNMYKYPDDKRNHSNIQYNPNDNEYYSKNGDNHNKYKWINRKKTRYNESECRDSDIVTYAKCNTYLKDQEDTPTFNIEENHPTYYYFPNKVVTNVEPTSTLSDVPLYECHRHCTDTKCYQFSHQKYLFRGNNYRHHLNGECKIYNELGDYENSDAHSVYINKETLNEDEQISIRQKPELVPPKVIPPRKVEITSCANYKNEFNCDQDPNCVFKDSCLARCKPNENGNCVIDENEDTDINLNLVGAIGDIKELDCSYQLPDDNMKIIIRFMGMNSNASKLLPPMVNKIELNMYDKNMKSLKSLLLLSIIDYDSVDPIGINNKFIINKNKILLVNIKDIFTPDIIKNIKNDNDDSEINHQDIKFKLKITDIYDKSRSFNIKPDLSTNLKAESELQSGSSSEAILTANKIQEILSSITFGLF